MAAKELAAQAWKDKNFPLAIEHYSDAINGTNDKEELKVLYSNRSAAFLMAKQNEKALEDAIRCVECDSRWLKGYGRKGDAFFALGKYSEAYNAYNAGLRIDSKDLTLQKKAEQAMNAIAGTSTSSESNSPNRAQSNLPSIFSQAQTYGYVFHPFVCTKLNWFSAIGWCSFHSFFIFYLLAHGAL